MESKFKDTPFWSFIRKSILDYGRWLEDIKRENDRLIASGESGINAMLEYNDTDTQTVITVMRAAVRFQQCTGEEYRHALGLMRIVDEEYRHELMKMELRHSGEIPESDVVHDILSAATDKYIEKVNGEECYMDIYEVAARALIHLNELGIISAKDRYDACHVLYIMDLESDSGIYKGVTI